MDGDKLLVRLSLAVALLVPITCYRNHTRKYEEYKFRKAHHFQCKEQSILMAPGEFLNLSNGQTIKYDLDTIMVTAPGHLPNFETVREDLELFSARIERSYRTQYDNVLYTMHRKNNVLTLDEIDCR